MVTKTTKTTKTPTIRVGTKSKTTSANANNRIDINITTLDKIDGAVSLFEPEKYNLTRNSTTPVVSTSTVNFIIRKIEDGESVWVRDVDPSSPWFGSIGIASQVNKRHFKLTGGNRANKKYSLVSNELSFFNADFCFNGKTTVSRKLFNNGFEYLPDYEGECFYTYDYSRTKTHNNFKVPTDRLNREISIGDTAMYVLFNFEGDSKAHSYFGKVSNIDKHGSVYCTNIPLKANEKQAERKINRSELLTILTQDLMTQVMLARLGV